MKNLKNSIATAVLCLGTFFFTNAQEIVFDTYADASASKATKYLLADDVALRDCPSSFCQKLTTVTIGTKVRLLAKSDEPQTLNGITSSWYKIKLGPDTGWVWGGLIAQKTMSSKVDNEVKFVFGEESVKNTFGESQKKRYQIRAIKNGQEIDKIVIKLDSINATEVANIGNKGVDDIIILNNPERESCEVDTTTDYVVFKNNKLQYTRNLVSVASQMEDIDCCYVDVDDF
ncbi:SH3 domain-containing protein [Lacinutrix salivirga]